MGLNFGEDRLKRFFIYYYEKSLETVNVLFINKLNL